MRTRIAIVRQSYRDDGGAERFVSRLLSVIGAPEIEVTLITRRWQELTGKLHHVSVLTCNPGYLGRLTREWRFSRAVQQTIKDSRFDLVQTNERIPGCNIYRSGDGVHREWLLQKARTQTLIGRIHSLISPYHIYTKWVEKKLLEDDRLNAVVCNSMMVKEEILKHFRIDENKIHVIYNGVDTDEFHPRVREHRAALRHELGLSDSKPVFLFVGSGFERKGLGTAIKAASIVPDANLVVVGNSKRITPYLRLARQSGCLDRIRFVGIVKDVSPWYGMADAMILPTLYDPFPNVVLEAMSCGLPVITSTHCGAVDIINSSQNGYLCDALDDVAIADCMQRLTDREHATTVGAAARLTVEPLTPERMKNQLTRLYMSLMESNYEETP
ncbi:MAG: glycosyltransferase family 4 protein [Planctomycetaceae bacterium]